MEEIVKKVSFYFDINNKSEVYDLLETLKKSKTKDAKIKRNKILSYIKLLEKYGVIIGEPICKHLDGEIYELRPLKDRILFFYHVEDQ